ncbi:MAG: glycosyltransferase family 4 protein, partial [Terriglobales bacterium]
LLLIVKILYVSQYFPPEMGAPAARASELARHWTRMGHEVTILTGFPNHPTGVVPPEWRSRFRRFFFRETMDRVNVVRTWLWPLPNRKAHERIRNYVSFCVSAAARGLGLSKPDVVIATSPQLLVALSGWWLAAWKNVPFVFEVRDLWPESLAAVGGGGENSLLHRALGAIAGFLYRRADHVVVVTPAFKDHLMRMWQVPEEKISIVENGVETDLFRPDVAGSGSARESTVNSGEGEFVICYVGTLGMAHGLETLIEAAEELRGSLPNASVLLIGEGAEKRRVVGLATARGLTNMRFMSERSREQIPALLSAADVCLVMLKKRELFKTVIPTKLLEYMACGRPVIVTVEGHAREIVEDAGAGVFVPPEDSHALAEAICAMARNPDERRQMGVNGRQFIVANFARKQTAEEYISVLERLLAGGEALDRPLPVFQLR